MATMLSGNFTTIVAPGLREVFMVEYQQRKGQYETVFNVLSSSRQYEKDQGLAALGALNEKAEGATITYDSFVERYGKTYTHVTYALGIRIAMELQADDMYSVMAERTQALARSAAHTYETVAANIFINGFATAGPDGVSLFNTAHPKISGSQANRPSTAADLSVTSLKAALTTFRGTTDDQGLKLVLSPSLLWVSATDEWLAYELLRSENRPHSADNEINVLRNRLEPFVWDYLTDTDAWGLLSAKSQHKLKFYNRMPVKTDASDDFDTKDGKFSVICRITAGFSDWRGTYGSPGA